LTGVLMLAGFGVFPLAALFAGFVAQDVTTTAYFPIAAALMGVAVLAGLAQSRWREFGAQAPQSATAESDAGSALESAPEPDGDLLLEHAAEVLAEPQLSAR
jgi:hypothetical protein